MKIITTATPMLVAALLAAGPHAEDPVPQALKAMADTEREFARTATERGIRDSFLEFFAEDSMTFDPAPTSARARLLKQPPQPFSVHELRWEPRTGDVAASGELGWLTGPSTFIDHGSPDPTPHHGNYLSVWRRQSNGRWRVFIDVGTSVPAAATFPPGFTRIPFGTRYAGTDGTAESTRSLLETDQRLNAAIAEDGAARGYGGRLTPGSRLHRPGHVPTTGAPAITAWLARHTPQMSAVSGSAEASRSGDLGYSYGTYAVAGGQSPSGAYVRLWSRDAAGQWFVMADVIQRVNPAGQR